MRPLAERFWAKVEKLPGEDACWLWTGYKSEEGYGVFNHKYAHRLAWELEHGSPLEYFGCHRCDNRVCVRPSHLFDGRPDQNSNDAAVKGRLGVKGERNGKAKLTATQVDEIRKLRAAGCRVKAIARIYGVSHLAISNIARGKAWNSQT